MVNRSIAGGILQGEIDKNLTFMLKKYLAVFYSIQALYTKAIYCTMYTI